MLNMEERNNQEQKSRLNQESLGWEETWSAFVAMRGEGKRPDVLFITPPSSWDKNNDQLHPGCSPKGSGDAFFKPTSPGIGMLASYAEGHGINAGVVNGELTSVHTLIGDHRLTPREAADLIVSSGSKIVGFSVLFPDALNWVKEVKVELEEKQGNSPVIIIGGAMASVARVDMARFLDIDEKNVIKGRGLTELDEFFHTMEFEWVQNDLINGVTIAPEFLKIPGMTEEDLGTQPCALPFLAIGGFPCRNGQPCDYCGGNYLSERRLNKEEFRDMLVAVKEAGYKRLLVSDNNININDAETLQVFLKRLATAQKMDLEVFSFFCRPEVVAATDLNVLEQIKDMGVSSVFVGIEFASPAMLTKSGRTLVGNEAEYLKQTIRACNNLKRVGLGIILAGMIAYPGSSREDDMTLIRHLGQLMSAGGKITGKGQDRWVEGVEIEINPTIPVPGSRLYKNLIAEGYSPVQLWEYYSWVRDSWQKVLNSLQVQDFSGRTISLESLILNHDTTVGRILDFADECRVKLGSKKGRMV